MSLVTVKQAIKDYPGNWDITLVPPPPFNSQAYQNRLNEITGLSDGFPILKLEWGGNTTVKKNEKWDSQGMPILISTQPKHAIPRRSLILEELQLVPIRRWIITQYQTKAQLRVDDNSDNTFTNEAGVNCIAGDKSQDPYTPLIYIGDHTNCPKDCCKKKICLGDYKEPGIAELNWVLESTFKLQSDRIIDPRKEITPEDMAAVTREVLDELDEKKKKAEENIDDWFNDWIRTHGHRITSDDPSVLTHGKYKFFKNNLPI